MGKMNKIWNSIFKYRSDSNSEEKPLLVEYIDDLPNDRNYDYVDETEAESSDLTTIDIYNHFNLIKSNNDYKKNKENKILELIYLKSKLQHKNINKKLEFSYLNNFLEDLDFCMYATNDAFERDLTYNYTHSMNSKYDYYNLNTLNYSKTDNINFLPFNFENIKNFTHNNYSCIIRFISGFYRFFKGYWDDFITKDSVNSFPPNKTTKQQIINDLIVSGEYSLEKICYIYDFLNKNFHSDIIDEKLLFKKLNYTSDISANEFDAYFSNFDKDNDGFLDPSDIQLLFYTLGIIVSKESVLNMMNFKKGQQVQLIDLKNFKIVFIEFMEENDNYF